MKIFAAAILSLFSINAMADFALAVSPPRIEAKVNPGGKVLEVISIVNEGQDAPLSFRTADWSMDQNDGAVFHDELQKDSCRQWVSIEKKEAVARSKKRLGYRVQVEVPKDAPAQECRFALMIEGVEPSAASVGQMKMNIAGRIAIIFYVAVGDAKPDLKIEAPTTKTVNGNRMPAVRVSNKGSAHGRLEGFLSGTDAKGNEFSFNPASTPVLAGDVRVITLTPVTPRKEIGTVVYPVTISGKFEIDGKNRSFEHKFE